MSHNPRDLGKGIKLYQSKLASNLVLLGRAVARVLVSVSTVQAAAAGAVPQVFPGFLMDLAVVALVLALVA